MDAKKDNKKGTYRGKRKVKAKTEENLLFQAKKTISRVVKIVRVYLIRKNLRLEEGKRKLSTDDLKVRAYIIFEMFLGGVFISNCAH